MKRFLILIPIAALIGLHCFDVGLRQRLLKSLKEAADTISKNNITLHQQNDMLDRQDAALKLAARAVNTLSTNQDVLVKDRDEMENDAMKFAFISAMIGYKAGMEGMDPHKFIDACKTAYGLTNMNVDVKVITNFPAGPDIEAGKPKGLRLRL